MILATFLKQPVELKDYDIDFSPWLNVVEDTLDNIDIAVICIDDELDTELVVERYVITEKEAKLWVRGGTSGYAYKVSVDATTTGGRLDQSELIFAVEDI